VKTQPGEALCSGGPVRLDGEESGLPDDLMRDVFICHASEDKEKIARPLVESFERAGISYWYDDADVEWGASVTGQVSEGLRKSRYVLVIFSPDSVQKPWPMAELQAVLSEEASTGGGKILPLLAGSPAEQKEISNQIREQLILLTDKKWLSWDGNPDVVTRRMKGLLGRQAVKRVYHISSEYPPSIQGGLGVHVTQLTSALGVHLDVVVMLPSLDGAYYETPHEHVEPRSLSNVTAAYADPVSWLRFADSAAKQVMLAAKPDRPDVIHCHDWVTVLAGIKCRWSLGIPMVFHLHLPNRNPLCASVENLGLICADQITVNSRAMYQELADRNLELRRKPDVVKIINNGVDQGMFRPEGTWPAAENYVFFAGRLVEQKGIEYLIRAFLYVSEKFPAMKLKIAGEGELSDALRKLAASLLLSDRVEFLGWRQPSELAALYQNATVAAVPSVYEPFGMTALEAMACKRPVVASSVGGLREIVKHGATGFLAEPRDELDLGQWLMALLSDPARQQTMGEAGLASVNNEGYTWSKIAQQYIGLYEELAFTPADRAVPRSAHEFIDQIAGAAREISPEVAPMSQRFLDELFDGSWS
jgi:glycogen synthase